MNLCTKNAIRSALLIAVMVLIVGVINTGASANTSTQQIYVSTSEVSSSEPLSLSAQGYPTGSNPFLVRKPFNETINNPLWINSFFDHHLPSSSEKNIFIPSDLRDQNGNLLLNFLNQSIENNSTSFGYNSYSSHNGIDYQLSYQPVIAPADGIIQIGRESGTCKVWIDHDASSPLDNVNDFSTTYFHLRSISEASNSALGNPERNPTYSLMWSKGDRIRAGEVIGISGNDPCGGESTGPHLHFAVYKGNYLNNQKQVLDPFGWWSSDGDPWADNRLSSQAVRDKGITLYPAQSLWAWAAPTNPGIGLDGYWGNGILAQTDNLDSSFQLFGPSNRREYKNGWSVILKDEAAEIHPIGDEAWLSRSIISETDKVKKNWAVWALHVPGNGQYRIQVHIPKAPAGTTATQTAVYTVYVPTDSSTYNIWSSKPVDQRANNEWKYLYAQDDSYSFNLLANTVVLVTLSDVTGINDEAVLFDAVRLEEGGVIEPPVTQDILRVGLTIDNSSSMTQSGKLSVMKSLLPAWIDQITQEGLATFFSLEAFADGISTVKTTNSPDQIKSWISALTGNDNGLPNTDCPEAQLDAMSVNAPYVAGGQMLLFTDDLPKFFNQKTSSTYRALTDHNVKLHVITLPKTCNFGSGNDPLGWLSYRFLALFSGGTYQAVSTDNTAKALEIVLSEMRANAQLNSAPVIALSSLEGVDELNGENIYPVWVDGSVSKLNVLLNIFGGSFTLALSRPDGSIVTTSDPGVVFTDSGSAKYYQINTPIIGEWQVTIIGTGEYSLSVSAETSIQFSYLGDTRSSPGQPIQLAARISGSVGNVIFHITSKDGSERYDISMMDDGQGNDFVAGDGLYMGWFETTDTGDYLLSVSGTTLEGSYFERADSQVIRVQGVRVTAPNSIVLGYQTPASLVFSITNFSSVSENYELIALADQNWITGYPPGQISIQAGETVNIEVVVNLPDTADPSSPGTISLTARSLSDNTVYADDVVVVFSPDFGIPDYPTYLPFLQR